MPEELQVEPRSNYGITRIDQPEKGNHGFWVRVTHRGETHHKYFADKSSGGRTEALEKARKHRNAILSAMPLAKQIAAARPPRQILRSGVKGVTHVVSRNPKGKVYEYWQAVWNDENGSRKTAKFSIGRYGNRGALEKAVRTREIKTGAARDADNRQPEPASVLTSDG